MKIKFKNVGEFCCSYTKPSGVLGFFLPWDFCEGGYGLDKCMVATYKKIQDRKREQVTFMDFKSLEYYESKRTAGNGINGESK